MLLNQIVELYQYLPEKIDPIAFSIGYFSVRWYSLMYLTGLGVAYFLLNWRIKKKEGAYDKDLIVDVIFYSILGILIGGRLGYALFYDFNYFINHLWEIFIPFHFTNNEFLFTGYYGMSYFGGLLGMVLSLYILTKKRKLSFLKLADFIVPVIPAGYFFGRMGNFLNGELYGRVTERVWGMYFPLDSQELLRHPSQLYEAFFEGIVLFIILWLLRNMLSNRTGFLLGIYLFGYGFFRFFIEFFRQPDPQVGLFFGVLTLGQIFSTALIIVAIFIILNKSKKIV